MFGSSKHFLALQVYYYQSEWTEWIMNGPLVIWCRVHLILLCHFFFSSAGLVLAVMAPRLSVSTRSDMVWQRVSWKLLENVPQRWVESVLTGLVQAVSG